VIALRRDCATTIGRLPMSDEKKRDSNGELTQYIRRKWERHECYNKSILGLSGFIFQSTLTMVLTLIISLKTYDINNRLFLPLSTVPLGIYFWFIWYRESRKLREHVKAWLNECGGVENVEIPKMSPFNMRQIPEVALVLVAEGILLIFFVAFLY
jgi:hypothetical protein